MGHLLDTGSETPHQWVNYEIPVRLMVHNLIKSKMVQAQPGNDFKVKGLTVTSESTDTPPTFPIQIKKIDIIHNPEFDKIITQYKLPIFFKSLPSRSTTHFEQGFVDNGR